MAGLYSGGMPGSILSRMTEKKHVKIDDYNATIDYPFPFKKYEQVTIDKDGQTGTVIDAEYIGDQSAAPHYTITYVVKSNLDGSLKELKLADILSLNRKRR